MTTITTSTNINNASFISYTWPLTIASLDTLPITITFIENIVASSITSQDNYFIIGSDNIIIDGGNYTIDMTNSTYGLIFNSNNPSNNGYSNITIQNISVIGTHIIGSENGGICNRFFGKNATNNNIIYCSNSQIIHDGGGICGSNFAQGGTGTISYCTNSGIIRDDNCGGICGNNCGSDNGHVTITNCSNSGTFGGGNLSGGICSSDCGIRNGNISISYCSNSADIISNYSGGIVGGNASNITINNCTNSGIISGNYSGGIAGDLFGFNSPTLCSIIDCTNTGNIIGINAGGICGAEVGYTNTISTNINITNCSSTGIITGPNASTCGSICGGTEDSGPYDSTITLTNCIGANPLVSGNLQSPPTIIIINNPLCFKKDTKILCFVDNCEEYVFIQNIKPGMLVKTNIDGYKKVEIIKNSKIHNLKIHNSKIHNLKIHNSKIHNSKIHNSKIHNSKILNRLYKCSTEEYPELYEDLYITGAHAILVDNLTDDERIKTIELLGKIYITSNHYRLIACIDKRAKLYEKNEIFTIYNFALENDNYYSNYGVYANGLLVESASKNMMTNYY